VNAHEALPSWRPGATRDAVLEFLDAAAEIPPTQRVAVFDNDGTLWCEKPNYPQLEFFLAELADQAARRPDLVEVAEYRALLSGDSAAVAELGLERIATALVDLCTGLEPEQFDARVQRWFAAAVHPDFGVSYGHTVYQPMIELIAAMRSMQFGVFLVTGGGTEFVRVVSRQLYGVEPEGVVGSMVTYEVTAVDGRPRLVRSNTVVGEVNEGAAKVANIQMALGRRPVFAAGNSHGDAMMLDYAMAHDGLSMAMLIDHDDGEREYAYESKAGSFESTEPVTVTAERSGWTVVSMGDDWSQIFRAAR
jgi:phosphoserine phosphatase